MEYCQKFPSIPKLFCAHCQGTVRATAEHPQFSIVETSYCGYPVIEVLKNGGPIHAHDQHFRFGRRKVEMLLAAMPAIHDFRWCSDEDRLRFEPRLIRDDRGRLGVRIYVEAYPEFEYSTGEIIYRPWLRLDSGDVHLGLGVMKCWAVWSVRDELRSWLDAQPRSPVIIEYRVA
jgi:hypothetical protein